MKKKSHNLYNRDGNNLWLEPSKTNDGWYKISSDRPIIAYQVTLGKENEIMAIDPPGGPFISLGKNQDKDGKYFVVEKINDKLELKLKK